MPQPKHMKDSNKKILIVEDDPNFGSILKEYLIINDYDITLAKNGIEGFEKFKKEEIEVDVVISSQAAMKIVGQLGQVLGPKGLMPNPKTGTVTEKVEEAINNAKSGQVRFRTDKNGILHGCIGKVSFSSSQIQENAAAMLEEVKKLKPATAKGAYIRSVALSSTMGPGVKVSPTSLVV